MSEATEADIEALINEMKNLRADFARIGDILKDTARHGAEDAKETVRETAEHGWYEAKSKAQGLVDEIEQRPVQSALAIFGVGILLGLLFGRR
jgi:ElaB/YqjD/DUF883 family membrane-anchored ribosome-binding protein